MNYVILKYVYVTLIILQDTWVTILEKKMKQRERDILIIKALITFIKFVRQSLIIFYFGSYPVKEKEKLSTSPIISAWNTIVKRRSFIYKDFADFPRTVKHVNVSWLEETAARSTRQDEIQHAVQLVGDYCGCPCTHR